MMNPQNRGARGNSNALDAVWEEPYESGGDEAYDDDLYDGGQFGKPGKI